MTRLVYVSGIGVDPESTWHDAYERNLRERLGDDLGRWEQLKGRPRSPAEERSST